MLSPMEVSAGQTGLFTLSEGCLKDLFQRSTVIRLDTGRLRFLVYYLVYSRRAMKGTSHVG
ncbi:hypothetical protein GCM10008938_09860 [Deinococcus roseus]|uniref:Uncharacterized protein n=1 Tax=Deinococcus roseus TaxID=392414 RepID=A0ABQ2CX83_9DEIO|nr:hypothetical protein GCM10008938_09860 [Deinococcus roseus]